MGHVHEEGGDTEHFDSSITSRSTRPILRLMLMLILMLCMFLPLILVFLLKVFEWQPQFRCKYSIRQRPLLPAFAANLKQVQAR